MSHRFTALVLSLLMLSPMCWCGWMHAAPTAHAEPPCCEAKAKDHSPAPPKGKECPCMEAPKARDLQLAKVTVPAPLLYDLHLPLLAVIELVVPRSDNLSAALMLRNHGPPQREARPLYHLDCALLI